MSAETLVWIFVVIAAVFLVREILALLFGDDAGGPEAPSDIRWPCP
ncbi:MAG TPA: hypothetical protein VGJ60_27305 [Chloroflexota bacterium]|jgi:hypothetical protein